MVIYKKTLVIKRKPLDFTRGFDVFSSIFSIRVIANVLKKGTHAPKSAKISHFMHAQKPRCVTNSATKCTLTHILK